jgi:NADH:ubiquinone oxidoreductase subunit E
LEPPGKHRISVCMGTACYLKGAAQILEEVKNILNVKEGQTTEDGVFSLDVVRCLGCCGLAPVVMIDEKVYGKVKKSEITEIISKYGNGKRED